MEKESQFFGPKHPTPLPPREEMPQDSKQTNIAPEKKPGKVAFNLETAAHDIYDATRYIREKKMKEHGGMLTSDQITALELDLQATALALLTDAKKTHRMQQREAAGPLTKYYHKVKLWYKELELTPEGRLGKEYIEATATGAAFLGSAVYLGWTAPTEAAIKLGTRVIATGGFQAGASMLVDTINKKNPRFFSHVARMFPKKAEGITLNNQALDPKNTNTTGNVSFPPEGVTTTLGQQYPEIDFIKLKRVGILLGTGFTLLLGGWLAAAATGTTLVGKDAITYLVKKKIEGCKLKLKALAEKIDVNADQEGFTQNLQEVHAEMEKLSKTIKDLELAKDFLKNLAVYVNGLIGVHTNLAIPIRRAATQTVGEFKDSVGAQKKLAKKKALEKLRAEMTKAYESTDEDERKAA